MSEQDAAAEGAELVRSTLLGNLVGSARYVIQPPYELDHDGVWIDRRDDEGKGPPRIRIAFAPLVIRRVFVDPDGEQLIELAWRDGHQVVARTVPRAVAKSGRKLVQALGNAGIPIVEADARQVERYLGAIEAANRSRIPREQVARRLGWQPDGEFVTGQDTPRHVEPVYDEQRPALGAFRPAGTLEDWQAVVKVIEPYPIPRFLLAAGFAAPLLEVLRLDSFTVDISGRSTGGKTTAAMLALSPWACPTEQGDGIASWRTTIIAAEKRLNLVNGLPTVFDETRVVSDESLVDKVLYQVPKNRGAARSAGWPSNLPWRTILVSTGEQPALSFTTHEGASARILSLRGAPFGRDGQSSATAARAVGDGLVENFGTAGPVFVERLRAHLAEPGAEESLRLRHAQLAEQHRGGSDVGNRRAGSVAVVRLAAELAHEWSIVPLEPLDVDAVRHLLTVEEQRDDRGAMALDIVREFVSRSPDRMWSPSRTPGDTPHAGWIGGYHTWLARKGADEQHTVNVLAEELSRELARCGYRIDAVREAWRERKLIALDKDGELKRRRLFGEGRQLRSYEFDRAVFDGQDEEPTETESQPPCEACGWPVGSMGHSEHCEASDGA